MSEQDVDRVVGRITKKLLWTLLPTILLTIGSMFIYDHFTLANKVDQETFQKNTYTLMLMIESKNRLLEDMAQANAQEIVHINGQIDELQDDINIIIKQKFGVRGISELPDF